MSEVALWRAVLVQAMIDIAKTPIHQNDRKRNGNALLQVEWDATYHWIFNDRTGDFRDVCEMAGVNYRWFRDRVKSLIEGDSGETITVNPILKYRNGKLKRRVRHRRIEKMRVRINRY
jgi:hypothetical protein